ncbi:MAG: hypothetical protein HRU15_20545 [Planctomycetes bacterium]|nr:hypothetical protein [Planctomycetota bacterium]
MNQKKSHKAISILNAIIPDNTDAYKNSRLLLARAFIHNKNNKRARPILLDLSIQDDSWGQTAKNLLRSL